MKEILVPIAILGVALTGSCAPAPFALRPLAPARADAAEVQLFEQNTARQVRRCYRTPPLARSARQIATRLRVRYAPDGNVVGFPIVVSQSGITDANRAYAEKMAEAASLAVMRCAPVHIPAAFTDFPWNDIDLVFSLLRHG